MNFSTMTPKRMELIRIGDFGFGRNDQSGIYCRPENREAVQAAYDAIDDDNLRDDVLDEVRAAGGVYIEEPANA